MFKSQISNQNGMPYEDSLEENWIKWNLVKAGRVLTICMWANRCFGEKLQFLQSVMKTTKSWDTLSIGNDSFQINASFSSDEESNDIGKKPMLKAKPPKGKKKR